MPEKKENKRPDEEKRDTAAETAIGTGVGAAGGGIAGAAIGTAVGGPIGTAVGAVIGAVTGGLAGAGIAEAVDSDAEHAYWREAHEKQPHAGKRTYDEMAPAYRTGYEGYGKYEPGTKFEEAEPTLRQDYENWWREHTSPTGATPTPAAPSWDEARPASEAAWRRVERGEAARLQLSEEQVNIRKREVESGAVRLRKVVRTETVNQPVDLKREEVVVERVPAGTTGAVPENAFKEGEVTVPLKREEPVVEKSAHVTGEVRLKKDVKQDTQNVQETVRKEDVKVEKEGQARVEPKRTDR